jgi:GPH family glycoside/pentoside/hexuronide:cation symporter
LKLILTLQFFGQFFGAPSMAVIWAMYADIADYSEWKNKRRATGLIFSASSMAQKMGWAVGGAVAGWLLAHYGFVAGAAQTGTARSGIVMLFSVVPAVPALIGTLLVLFYALDEKRMHTIQAELAERRKADARRLDQEELHVRSTL